MNEFNPIEDNKKNLLCKSTAISNKYPELIFLDKIMTFVACMYVNDSSRTNPVDLFRIFMKTINVNKLLEFINSKSFYNVIIGYFSSRFLVQSLTHVRDELYCLPIAMIKNADKDSRILPTYYLFFEPAHIVELILSTFKLYYLNDADSIHVENTIVDTVDASTIETEYKFLLNRYEADPLVNALAQNVEAPPLTDGHENKLLIDNRETEEDQQSSPVFDPTHSYVCPNTEPAPAPPVLSTVTVFHQISEAIYDNPDTFLLLTIVLQVLESFQFVDSTAVDKAVQIAIRTQSKTFARSRITRSNC